MKFILFRFLLSACLFSPMTLIQPPLALSLSVVEPGASQTYSSQSPQQRANVVRIMGTLRPLASAYGQWGIEDEDDGKIYHIMNPENWTDQSWFKAGTTVELIGNLRPDIKQYQGYAVVASEIHFVKSSAVQGVEDKIPKVIRDQITEENVKKYGSKIPFLERLLDWLVY